MERNDGILSLVEIWERYYSVSDTSYSEKKIKKKFRVPPTGIKPMTYRTPVRFDSCLGNSEFFFRLCHWQNNISLIVLTCLNVSLGTALAWHFLRYSSQEKSSSSSSSDPEIYYKNISHLITTKGNLRWTSIPSKGRSNTSWCGNRDTCTL